MSEPADQPEVLEGEHDDDAPDLGPDGDGDDAEAEQTLEQAAADYGSSELWEQLDKANDAYIGKVIKIVGPNAPLKGCEACQGRGFTLGEQQQVPELLAAEDAVTCEKCNGYGQTKTGALEVPTAQPFKPCGGCGGRGWHEKRIELPPVAVLPLPPQPVAPQPGQQPLAGQWVPGRGFIPYGASEPVVPDLSGVHA